MSAISKGLNTPFKRVGSLALSLGLIILLVGIYQITDDSYRAIDALEKWWDSVFFDRHRFREYPAACYGTWITIAGLLASFMYDSVTSKLVMWIAGTKIPDLPQQKDNPQLHFKDGNSAIEYICKYMDTKLVENEITPCFVVATSQSKDSGSFAVIQIPTDNGPKKSVAAFLGDIVPTEIAGRLCAAMIGPINPVTGDPVFMLCAELEPTWSNEGWKIKRRF